MSVWKNEPAPWYSSQHFQKCIYHFVIAPACNDKKLQPYFFYINLSMLNCTKIKVFFLSKKVCMKMYLFQDSQAWFNTTVTKLQKVQLLKDCTKFHRFTRITDHQDGWKNTTCILTLLYSTCKLLSLTSSCTNYGGTKLQLNSVK